MYQFWFVEKEEHRKVDLSSTNCIHSAMVEKLSCEHKFVIKEDHQVYASQLASNMVISQGQFLLRGWWVDRTSSGDYSHLEFHVLVISKHHHMEVGSEVVL